MERIIIFGNSGSGKSTLAKALARLYGAEHLDLDTIAWERDRPGVRADFAESRRALLRFMEQAESWVIEGCYAELLKVSSSSCTELIFLNPGIEACVSNCMARPFEAHKYESKIAQDANLKMLIDWVRQYETRTDEFSLREHRKLFDAHAGRKVEYNSNEEAIERLRNADFGLRIEKERKQ